MSTTSSIETPTSPSAPVPSQHYNHHNHQHHPHQHTTTAIVAGAGAAHHHTNSNQFNRHRSHSSSSSSNNSFTAATSVNSKKLSATPHIHHSSGNNYNCSNNNNNSGEGNNYQKATHSPLTPSSSTSSSPSVSASASISAAVHHSHSHQQHHYHQQQQQKHYSYLHRCTTRPPTSLSDPDGVVAVTSSNFKRHADVSVCSSGSSSSCCSSTGSVSAVGVISTGSPATNIAIVTPSVLSSSSGAVITQKLSRAIPSDKINLRLILVSGKTKEFLFNPSDSAGDIAQTVFDNWPEDWEREAVPKAEILRLIYQGRFLHCNVTLGALGLPMGKTTVMHLVPRDNLPEPNSQDQRQKSKGGSGRCCSTTCCIL